MIEGGCEQGETPDADGADKTEEEENPMMETVRSKCITQLLLLGAIDSIQKRYWSKLQATQQIAIMDILLSLLEFASSYNSPSNLRTRMHHIPPERPPLNLLRQELAGTIAELVLLLFASTWELAFTVQDPDFVAFRMAAISETSQGNLILL
ncbi:hypothetical protein ZWY2020_005922 [Hordeum vulgare]|nr:hypothetical protein ZWY2020_005922 [Hordeum vulgare]